MNKNYSINILHKAIIRKLERLCKEKLRTCKTKGHPNSEVMLDKLECRVPAIYLKCLDCGTIYVRNATPQEIQNHREREY